MSRIRILPDALASQVAAGEVVERPAAVVRELMENSLDAGATRIEVHVQRGGSSLLKVVDDGHGMDREDALLCLERHATSKIRVKEDLAAIHTLGFRGEAVPSIASVSRFRLATRQANSLTGTEVEVNGGKLTAVRDHGGAPGTVVEARSLFYNVPARRKFLRSEQTEFSHVEQQFRLHAIANPGVAFTLIKDGGVVFHLPATDDIRSRIEGLTGRDLASRLLTIKSFQYKEVKVHGCIASAGISRPNKQMQYTFLNGRPVDSPIISHALREGYHTALMKGQFPVTFLFIEMPADGYDINVHPAKKEVRFFDGIQVREAVSRAVQETLGTRSGIVGGHASASSARNPFQSTTTLQPTQAEMPRELLPSPPPSAWPSAFNTHPQPSHPVAQPPAQSWTHDDVASIDSPPVSSGEQIVSPPSLSTPGQTSEAGSAPMAAEAPHPDDFRILGVLHKLYVLMENREGLVLMDQHAAHERVLFEQMLKAMETKGVPSQRLLIPLTWEVSPRDFELLERSLPVLRKLGIEAEAFGRNSFKIDALPTFLKTDDPLALLRDVVDELGSATSRTSALRLGEDMIATTVCRHAVKANDYLREAELRHLLRDLLACEMPYCCPHGRPTLIQISLPELERKFGRRTP